ncbi:MAG TPA: type IV secretory system conjugative DNA transfer family protein, partial [Candidatus Paceibacterota bacterium]|nr:type IV secretory system conjugative DNA transfer family protein [Candidatus Paceibacterota bacterium]
NTLLALLEYPGATLLGVNKMYSDKAYRKKVVDNITDPSVKSFWVDEFAKYTDKFAAEATPAIQNKIGQFTNNPLIRNIIGQPKSSFDIRKMMDERKIMIVNLSKGRVGESNANLLGAMLITKIYLAAMSRADVSEKVLSTLPQFYLYVDEFQSFANESFADILSEARKYKLNLTIAHQYIEQMSDEVRAAVFGNVGTMVVFRVGAYDADVLEKEFAPQFTAEDIVNLGQFQMYLRLMIDGVGSQPFSGKNLPPIAPPAVSFREQVVQSSRAQFGQLRSIVEEHVRVQTLGTIPEEDGSRPPRQDSQGGGRTDRGDFRPPREPRDPSSSAGGRPFERRGDAPRNGGANGTQNGTQNGNGLAPSRRPDRPRPAPPPDGDGGFQTFDSLKGLVSPRPPQGAAPEKRERDAVNGQPKPEKKGVTEESRNDLRQALAALSKSAPQKPVAEKKDDKPKDIPQKPQPQPQPQPQQPQAQTQIPQAPAPQPAPVKPNPVPVPQPAAERPVAPKPPETLSQPVQNKPQPEAKSSPKEVPEDVLKRLLDM